MSGSIAVITGPTATGKTALGVILAQYLNGEVVSADSMQVYRRMDIGTAKPTPEEMGGVPHYMIDVAEPWESFSAARYVEEATACVEDILARGKLPLIVGGTGLYIDSLIMGRDFAAAPGDVRLRYELSVQYDDLGGENFRRKLAEIDPVRAAKLSPGDKKRLVRALEVYLLTGKTITEHDEATKHLPPRYRAATIVLSYKDRENLYARIDSRVDGMVRLGLVDEVCALLTGGLSRESTAMQAIGYKEIARALDGESPMDEAIALIKRESRRYAKRQLTWFRRNSGAFWITWDEKPDFDFARRSSTAFLSRYGIK
ncbi:MAG: tRNA (adenosine(37)-N6)-dimethylallyltransferase MiaA [Oscillospiraceae bacterium]